MSFEDVWQEHKSFITAAVGGAIVFATAHYFIADHYDAAIRQDRAAVRGAEAKAKAQKLEPGRMQAVEAALETLAARLEKVEAEYAYRPSPGYTLDGIAKAPDVHFNEVVAGMVTNVVEAGLARDIRIQADLGLGGVTPKNNAERAWFLTGLDLVNRIAVAGIAAGVRTIEPIQIARPPQQSRERQRAASPYLRSIAVTASAVGHPRAVDAMVRALMLPGSRLSVEQATILSLDEDNAKQAAFGEQSVRLELTVKALILDPNGEPQRARAPRL